VTSEILSDVMPAGQGGLTTITPGGTGWTSYVGMVLFCGGVYDAYRIISATNTTVTLDRALNALNVGSAYFVLPYYDDLAARALVVTNLDATISSRAPASTALTGGILADSVPADGTRPTPEQALYAIYCYLMERAVSGTTVTVKKVDGSTALMTFTINDASAPTSITRTT
jgi:hypothetical protein